MPTDSVDMFSGLDGPGFAAEAVQVEARQPSPEPLVDRNVRYTCLLTWLEQTPDC